MELDSTPVVTAMTLLGPLLAIAVLVLLLTPRSIRWFRRR